MLTGPMNPKVRALHWTALNWKTHFTLNSIDFLVIVNLDGNDTNPYNLDVKPWHYKKTVKIVKLPNKFPWFSF